MELAWHHRVRYNGLQYSYSPRQTTFACFYDQIEVSFHVKKLSSSSITDRNNKLGGSSKLVSRDVYRRGNSCSWVRGVHESLTVLHG